jgi:glycosyltransferase involved in cell wall biosynthesis
MTHNGAVERVPKVSFGMPVYNGAQKIAQALDSVLAQSLADFEVVISDNASTDATSEICRDYERRDPRVRYFRNERNLGVARNYNRVFDLARGEYFKWTPHDDLLAPDFLVRCMDVLERDGSVVLVTPKPQLIDEEGNPDDFDRRLRESISERGLHRVPVDGPRFLSHARASKRFSDIVLRKVWFYELYGLIRSSTLRRTGLLRPFHGSCQILLAELALLGRIHEIPEHLLFIRHPYFKVTDARPKEMAVKMDPEWSGRLFVPEARIVTEWLKVVAGAPVGAADKARSVSSVGRKVMQPDNLAKLLIPGPNNYLGINLVPGRRRRG